MKTVKQKSPIVKITTILILVFSLNTSCNKKQKEQPNKNTSSQIEKPVNKRIYGYYKDSVNIVKNVVKKNQNLSDILLSYNVSLQKINEIATVSKPVFDVRKFATNKEYEVICSKDSSKQAKCFIYHPNPVDYILYKFDNDKLTVSKEHFPVSRIEKTSSGTINSSLYNTLVDEGNSTKLATKLSDIYAWQIDFFGIQKGDKYKIIFDELYVNDEFIGVGDIKAAYFDHMNTPHYAFRYEQDSNVEYFDETGNSFRKAS